MAVLRQAPAIEAFPPAALAAWSAALGQEVFTGSSGRVFPRALKASPLLRAWLARLASLGVEIRTRHRWLGFAPEGGLRVEGLRMQVLSAREVRRTPSVVVLRVTDRVTGGVAVGRGVRSALPVDAASTRVIRLERRTGRWLVASVRRG